MPRSKTRKANHSFYTSVTTQWSSNSRHGAPHGTRNTVSIKNGVGVKKKEALGPSGRVIESKTKKLNRSEIGKITNGAFVPGLWRSCGLRCLTRS
jgi:hypothetical protein